MPSPLRMTTIAPMIAVAMTIAAQMQTVQIRVAGGLSPPEAGRCAKPVRPSRASRAYRWGRGTNLAVAVAAPDATSAAGPVHVGLAQTPLSLVV